MAENSVTLTGTLGGDPVQRATAKGDVTTFSLAYSTRIKTDDGWVDGATSWFEVAVWGSLGRNALGSLKKGQRAIVHGTVSVNEWDTNGTKGRKAQIRASAVGHDLTFGTSEFTRSGSQRPQADPPRLDPQQLEQRPQQPALPAAQVPQPALQTVGVEAQPPADWGTSFGGADDVPF